jgi:hypothetical protein
MCSLTLERPADGGSAEAAADPNQLDSPQGVYRWVLPGPMTTKRDSGRHARIRMGP